MRSRSALIRDVILTLLVGALALGCNFDRPPGDSSSLDIGLTGANSPQDIENKIKASLAEKYPSTDTTHSYTIYQVTNGPARWVFAKVYNAPRGLSMFNLFCYEQEGPHFWPLRGYVPLNAYYYTNSDDWDLTFQTDREYVKAIFRGRVIFTGLSQSGVTNAP